MPRRNSLAALGLGLLLTGCAGSHVLDEPADIELNHPLAVADDGRVTAMLEWVVVKDGPGTWASNAFWDEYQLQLGNTSESDLTIVQVQVVDSLGTTHVPAADRDTLLYASKLTEKRYAAQSLDVQPGAGTFGMVAAGVAGGAVAFTAMGATLVSSAAGTAGVSGAAVAPMTTFLAYSVPLLVVGGIVHAENNAEVSEEIAARQTPMPVVLMPGEHTDVRVFVPVAPSPRAVRIIYRTGTGAELLEIDTSEVLEGLHFADPNAPSRRPREGSL
ncbi:MAG: hypothetical protein QNJ00_16055 [Woeseiaceae bacterium]|nr:hypothetical protein [Woeseiaceae bacterium]